jgi:hypothetical protein
MDEDLRTLSDPPPGTKFLIIDQNQNHPSRCKFYLFTPAPHTQTLKNAHFTREITGVLNFSDEYIKVFPGKLQFFAINREIFTCEAKSVYSGNELNNDSPVYR